jgi:hypothetical protein
MYFQFAGVEIPILNEGRVESTIKEDGVIYVVVLPTLSVAIIFSFTVEEFIVGTVQE